MDKAPLLQSTTHSRDSVNKEIPPLLPPPSPTMANTKEGLQHPRAVLFLVLWYIFSAATLFLNKHMLSFDELNPFVLCKYTSGKHFLYLYIGFSQMFIWIPSYLQKWCCAGGLQMTITMLCGAFQTRYPLGCYTKRKECTKPPNYYKNMATIGLLQ